MITGGVASGATTRRTKGSFGRMTRTSAIFSDDVASKLYLESSALHSTARLPFGLRSRSPVANVNFDGHFRRNRSFMVRRFAKGSQDVACDDAKKVRDMYRSHVSHAATPPDLVADDLFTVQDRLGAWMTSLRLRSFFRLPETLNRLWIARKEREFLFRKDSL